MNRALQLCILVVFSTFMAANDVVCQTKTNAQITIDDGTQVRTVDFESDQQLRRIIESLSAAGGGELRFSNALFQFDHGIEFEAIKNVHFRGQAGTEFRFRKMTEFGTVEIIEKSALSSGILRAKNADQLRIGARYQLFRPSLEGNRLIECVIAAVDGDKVTLGDCRNQLTKFAEPGNILVPQLNFFEGFGCSQLSFEGITFNGNCDVNEMKIGDERFRGHTAHCGILMRNIFKDRDDFDARSVMMAGLSVRNCNFRNLLGRGLTAYNMSDVFVENCSFEGFGAEALEIDHLTQDVSLIGLRFKNCMMGMRLNDCVAVAVSSSQFTDCEIGIHITDAIHDPLTNRAISIQGNTFRGGYRGIIVDGNGEENVIQGNVLQNVLIHGIIVHGSNNVVTGNLISGVKRIGIADYGQGNLIENNLVKPASNAAKDFQALIRDPKDG